MCGYRCFYFIVEISTLDFVGQFTGVIIVAGGVTVSSVFKKIVFRRISVIMGNGRALYAVHFDIIAGRLY